jgi:hypothetical protein
MATPRSGVWTALRPALRHRRAAIPAADFGAFAREARRTWLLRVLLAAGLIGCLVTAYVVSGRLDVKQGGFLPAGTSGVLVLDLSTSVSAESNRRIARVFRDTVAADEPIGAVFFSDTAYEMVPTGTRGTQLEPMLRYFVRRRLSRADRERLGAVGAVTRGPESGFIANPWMTSFRGGTRISAGLRLAREMIRRDGVGRPSVLLVSDLDFSPFDFSALTEELLQYKTEGISLRIVPLLAASEDREIFTRLLGGDAVVDNSELGFGRASSRRTFAGTTPNSLIAVGALLLILLAANEWWGGRLSWQRRPGGRP